MSSPSLVQSCLWTVTWWVPLVQQKLLTLPLSGHMCSLSLVQSCLWTVTRWVPLVQQKLITFITAHEFTQPCSILSLNSDTMCAPSTAETSYLYHSTWVQFTQPCSILSLNSDAMCGPSAAETSYLDQTTWVHSALFNLVFEQSHDVCP